MLLVSPCSVTPSCPTLCDPVDWGMPGFPVLHYFRVCSISGSLSPWCHPIISSSVVPFSSCLQSFLASGSFLMSQLFALGGQSIGASASASVLPMNIQDWIPLGLTGLISLHSKGLSRVFSNTTVPKHQFFGVQPSLWFNSQNHTWLPEKTVALTIWTSVDKVMSLLFNMLFKLVRAFLPSSKRFLYFMAAVTIWSDFGASQNKVSYCFHCFLYICHELMGLDAMIFIFWMLSFKPSFSLSSFTFIKRLFSSSLLFAIRVVSSAYLRLLIFHLAILIPACASSSPAFLMYSPYS